MSTVAKPKMNNVVQAMAEILRGAGTPYVFGYPGGEIVEFMNAVKDANIPFLLTKHENTAAFAAGVTGEIMGIPGVCVASMGPGAANMAAGIANAWMDRDPVIALTGQVAAPRYNTATHQVMDSVAFYKPITKWSASVHPGSAALTMHKAIRLAMSERPGPVHLALSSDQAKLEAGGKTPANRRAFIYSGMGEPCKEAAKKAAQMIAGAKRPSIFAGLGVLRANASKSLVRLAEKLGAPVVVTPKAKGVIPEDHALFAGVFGMLGDGLILQLCSGADLIIACGLDAVEYTKPWIFEAPVVHIDAVSNTDEFYPADVELIGHPDTAMAALTELLSARQTWTVDEIASHRRDLLALITRPGNGMASHEVVAAARKILPRETVATSDVGSHKKLVGQLWKTYTPKSFFMSNGLSSMGYGFPAAIAAKLAWPEKPVVAFLGDGGFSMYMGELETARRLNLPLIIVVLCDQALSLIAIKQEQLGLPYNGVHFDNPDIAKVADAFGAEGRVCTKVAEVEAAISSAYKSCKLTVIQAMVDSGPYRL
ncbi:MAG: thiamine pyrophosphate-binding protein [Candidatus Korobacteraceae bacterium]|jgi:acetolactate synthase-1/2/3 large subunit